MLKKYQNSAKQVTADVIVLGCTLPGIVTAHNLLQKFGNTMDIVVLDFGDSNAKRSQCNVAFQSSDKAEEEEEQAKEESVESKTALTSSFNKRYLIKCLNDFNIPFPAALENPKKGRSRLHKLFQHVDGSTVTCQDDYHDFTYLNVLEKFELNQYQRFLNYTMNKLFYCNRFKEEQSLLQYYDRLTMEEHFRCYLIFTTSIEIMRVTVRLVCGVSASTVSVLFYLHQLFRVNGAKNIVDGDNTRTREKLLGYCKKRLSQKLEKSIKGITMRTTRITEIGMFKSQQLILKTLKGETNYVCNLVAMAVSPDQLSDIIVEDALIVHHDTLEAAKQMSPGRAKKFYVQYEDSFWRRRGYSGDIFSVRGPIFWAMERPKLSTTGSMEKYSALVGFLKITNDSKEDSREAVLAQLVELFGEEAAMPVAYKETQLDDVFVPCLGSYVALKKISDLDAFRQLTWGGLDIFAEGDVSAALEAGYSTYLQLLRILRPQAQTFEDISVAEYRTILTDDCFSNFWSQINFRSSVKSLVMSLAIFLGLRYIQSVIRKT